MKQFLFFVLTVICVSFASCSKDESKGVEYVPYQETEKGQWCMISPNGEILFSEEFKNTPTVAQEGRFMVKNDKGLWEIYTAEAKPKKVGGEYLYATNFKDGKALVAERNGYVTIIDKEGKEVKVLDKIDNKIVDAVQFFSEGYAIYKTGDYYGAIDNEGKEVIKPNYIALNHCLNGKFVGVNKKYEKEYGKENTIFSYDIIDTNGKVLFSINKEKYSNIGANFVEGLIPVATKIDGEECWGLINDKNEVIVKPSAKIKKILDIRDGKFIYNNGEGCGLMNIEGEVLIRAKYEHLTFEGSNRMFAITEKTVNSFDYKCRLIDEEDNRIGDEEFSNFYSFINFDGKHAFVKVSDKMWSIIDIEGKQLPKLPDMVNIGISTGDTEVINDHIDFSELFKEMKLGKNQVDEFTLEKTTAKDAAKIKEKYNPELGSSDHPVSDPYWYNYIRTISYDKTFNKVETTLGLTFPDYMSRSVYRTEHDNYGYFTYSHDVLSGYEFNNIKPSMLIAVFSESGILKGKLKLLFNALNEHVKKLGGKLEKSNENAAVYTISKEIRVLLFNKDSKISMIWGDLKPVNEIDISEYADDASDVITEVEDSIAAVVD